MHHANIIISEEDCRNAVFGVLEKNLNFKTNANPDFLLVEKEFLGIDDARDLEKWAIGRPFTGDVKVSLLIAKYITHEAQNALLKVLEEPPLGTYIFISLGSLGGVLPTFISRVRILDLPVISGEIEKPTQNTAFEFLRSGIKEKLAIIHSLSNKKDKNEMKELIKDLEKIAYKKNFKHRDLKNILTAKFFVSARGSSPKMLFEWLSCRL